MSAPDLQHHAARIQADPRWQRVLARDASADGSFVFSVRSTGVYCRPSCPARRARPENVDFHPDPAAAEAAGFRACLRCRPGLASPQQRQAALVASLCRYLAAAERAPTLAELARHAGLSAWHLQRVFRAHTGLSPSAYSRALRAERLRAALPAAATVTEAAYAAGYGSSARLYADATQVLGMPPARYRRGASGQELRYAISDCSLGRVLVACSPQGICAIALGAEDAVLEAELAGRFPQAQRIADAAGLGRQLAQVLQLVEQPGAPHDLPLDLRGTPFQQRVWQALQTIPAGGRISYTALALRLGLPHGARAVAAACAANPLAVAVPCHRVVRSDGDLAGYRWGLERKARLLAREAQSASAAEGGPPAPITARPPC